MTDYIGKKVVITTENGVVHGKLTSFNKDSGKLTLEDSYNISNELDLVDIVEVQMEEDRRGSTKDPGAEQGLKEEDMYSLFYDAFNVYGPFEDNFCSVITTSLKKFIKDTTTSRIRIVVGTDDIFGRVGLCFARFLLDRVEHLDVECACEIHDLRTQRYVNAFINCGGCFVEQSAQEQYTMVVFACNRSFDFSQRSPHSGLVLLLDLPPKVPFASFTGLGLGFTPEHYNVCPKSFYLVDAGFGSVLCNKYKICKSYKSSLVKIDISRQ